MEGCPISGKKELIMSSAAKLLEQKEYREITVLDLVADSGVNRNTFYYHFKDMPMLVLELARKAVDSCFTSSKGNAEEKLCSLAERMCKSKVKIMHVYSSADRAVFDKGLDALCEYIASRLFSPNAESQGVGEAEKNSYLLMIKCSLYGFASDWFSNGLDEAGIERLRGFCGCFPRLIKE